MSPWNRAPLADPSARARVLADLNSPDFSAWTCAVTLISSRSDFDVDLPQFLGPPDPATGLPTVLPGVDPEQARVLMILKVVPREEVSRLWEGAGPAAREAVLLRMGENDPGRCTVFRAAAFDSNPKVERVADQLRPDTCPLLSEDIPHFLASEHAHSRQHGVILLRDALPARVELRRPNRDCTGRIWSGSCREYRAKAQGRWTRTERDAVAQLRLLAVQDPDPEIRKVALASLAGARLGLEEPLPPVFDGAETPEDGGCGGE